MKISPRLMSFVIMLLGAMASRANCPTPVSSNGWGLYSAVSYNFGQGYGGCGLTCPISWASIPSTQADVQNAAGLWTAANLTQNSTGIVFSNVYCCAPLTFFAEQVAYPGTGFDPGKAAQTITGVYTGTNITAFAHVTFEFGSIDPASGVAFYDSVAPTYDAFISKVALHEMGHTMGLQDQPTTPYAYCGGQTASQSVMNAGCGTNDSLNNLPTNVTTCDNQSCY